MKPRRREELLKILSAHFEKSMCRQEGLEWPKVQARLEAPLPRDRREYARSAVLIGNARGKTLTVVHNCLVFATCHQPPTGNASFAWHVVPKG
jgi:hypothetical protein